MSNNMIQNNMGESPEDTLVITTLRSMTISVEPEMPIDADFVEIGGTPRLRFPSEESDRTIDSFFERAKRGITEHEDSPPKRPLPLDRESRAKDSAASKNHPDRGIVTSRAISAYAPEILVDSPLRENQDPKGALLAKEGVIFLSMEYRIMLHRSALRKTLGLTGMTGVDQDTTAFLTGELQDLIGDLVWKGPCTPRHRLAS